MPPQYQPDTGKGAARGALAVMRGSWLRPARSAIGRPRPGKDPKRACLRWARRQDRPSRPQRVSVAANPCPCCLRWARAGQHQDGPEEGDWQAYSVTLAGLLSRTVRSHTLSPCPKWQAE